ncbi:MAG: glycosyltransferase family 4 protein [Aulosira sp. ZfuVER01]|nr:glycosyltransferase family 4 protein [Aulosira sp. ZfuVER01]MDZ8003032.1 glycosyltransferase family 4 protein [Aulosira sp. DedVER01a]MDZ8050292.1 glycosyltransferase family 4 protein [Aulosira sp. ZfuCHP01]
MKLAFITATPQNAKLGSGTFVGNAHLITQLRSQGHKVDVFAPNKASGPMGYMVQRFRWNWGLDPLDFDKYDAVIGLDMDGYTIGDRIKAPFIAYIHGIIADEAKFERGWVRTSLELMAKAEQVSVHRANMAIATSEYSSARLAQLYNYKGEIEIVPPPIDVQGWDRALGSVTDSEENITNPRPTILCVGVQYPRKNVATLIRATAILRRQIPDVEVRIASQGPEWNNLRRLTQELDLNQNVTFLGYVPYEYLVREYVRCHVFCLPSLQEGFGIVFAEAMASSKPIVASRSSSTPELIEDGVQGLLATPLDPEDLARCLAEVLLSPEKALALGKAGRAKVVEFDAPAIAQKFSQLLTKL